MWDGPVLFQIEDSLCWTLENEPQRYHLHYCLGFFNWKAKGDRGQAINHFERFLQESNDSKFEKEKQLATQWIEDIKTEN